jgi:hypothetical protein
MPNKLGSNQRWQNNASRIDAGRTGRITRHCVRALRDDSFFNWLPPTNDHYNSQLLVSTVQSEN